MDIDYRINEKISATEFVDLLKKTSLGCRRPIEDILIIQGMLDHANLTITAWFNNQLIGIARSVTDYHFCCYLSELAVDETIQAKGIGRRLIKLTKEALSPNCMLVLLSAPQAESYYPKVGFDAHNSAWTLHDIEKLES
jgi:GNAT superfamily N-acetyltransferase